MPDINLIAYMREHCTTRCNVGEIARLSQQAVSQYRRAGVIDQQLLEKIEAELTELYS